jgi:hypothetical protein
VAAIADSVGLYAQLSNTLPPEPWYPTLKWVMRGFALEWFSKRGVARGLSLAVLLLTLLHDAVLHCEWRLDVLLAALPGVCC